MGDSSEERHQIENMYSYGCIKQEISKAHTTSYSPFIASPPHVKYCPIHGHPPLQDVNEQMIIENIVAGGTRQAYIADSLLFARRCLELHQAGWLTADARNRLQQLEIEAQGMWTRQGRMHIKSGLTILLQNTAEEPVILQNEITPSGFMVYLQGLRHWHTKERLSISANRKHLIRVMHLITVIIWSYKFDLSSNMNNIYRLREY